MPHPPDDLEFAELCGHLKHSYWPCDPVARQMTPKWVADLESWARLGRAKLPLDDGPKPAA